MQERVEILLRLIQLHGLRHMRKMDDITFLGRRSIDCQTEVTDARVRLSRRNRCDKVCTRYVREKVRVSSEYAGRIS